MARASRLVSRVRSGSIERIWGVPSGYGRAGGVLEGPECVVRLGASQGVAGEGLFGAG